MREGGRGQWIRGIWKPGGTMARDHSEGTVKECERCEHCYNCRFINKKLVSVESKVLFCGEIQNRLEDKILKTDKTETFTHT